jgi:hypothetical protein
MIPQQVSRKGAGIDGENGEYRLLYILYPGQQILLEHPANAYIFLR